MADPESAPSTIYEEMEEKKSSPSIEDEQTAEKNDIAAQSAPASKAGRGRPRKHALVEEPESSKPKRARGRPRKSQEPETNGAAAAAEQAHSMKSTRTTNKKTSEIENKNADTDKDTTSTEAHMAHAQKHITFLLANSPIYTHLLSNVKLHAASSTSVTTRLALAPHHLNSKGSLHGSVTATFVDFIGGVAIAASDLRDNTGVSTDIHVSYCGRASAGQTVEIEGVAEKVGGTLAFTRVVVRIVEGDGTPGRLVAMGRHTKFVKA